MTMEIKNKKYSLFDIIRIPLTVTPLFTTIRIVDKIIYALIPSLQILVTASFLDTAIKIFNNQANRSDIYLPLIFIFLTVAYQYVGYALLSFVTDKMNMRLTEKFRVAVVEKRAKLKYEHIENNDTWEIINRIGKDPLPSV